MRVLMLSWEFPPHVVGGMGKHVVDLAPALVQQGRVPDVIVSDYRLRGGHNGLQTIQSLRQAIGLQVPACLISGDTDPEVIQAVRQIGLTLLHKPVRIAKLRSLLTRLKQVKSVQ